MEQNKINGSYYTPEILAKYLVEKTLSFLKNDKIINVLEPSCGDGAFLKEFLNNDLFLLKRGSSICSVEKDSLELKKAKKNKKKFSSYNINTSFYHQDFLEFSLNRKKKFNLIIGNPPYIYKKHLSKEQKELSKLILNNLGIKTKTIYNIWIPFVVASLNLLNENGVLCFILPSEMLQVNYAIPIRELLYQEFDEIHLISFENRIFEGIEQDVVVFIGVKNSNNKSITHDLICNKEGSLELIRRNVLEEKQYFKKWLWYLLSNEEIKLLLNLKKKFSPINKYCRSVVGIVTGNNSYFILNKNQVKTHYLEKWVKPILKKSSYIKDSLIYKDEDFCTLVESEDPCFLLDFNKINSDNIPVEVQNYLNVGKELNVNQGYKCKERSEWYKIPSIWASEGFFFKRIHLFPKIISNSMGVFITDTGYRISMNDNYNIFSLIFSFYNSLTLLFLELEGRYYGGGVLEITPNEFKNIIVPYIDVEQRDFIELQKMVTENASIEEIVDFTDEVILKRNFLFKDKEINSLRKLREKIVKFRVN